jgi:outer membrane protein OmpA-like peptidoglycan-associated protein
MNKVWWRWLKAAATLGLLALSGSFSATLAAGEKPTIPSTAEIIQRLSTSPESLPLNMRGITVIKPSGGTQKKPNIDLAINFEFNSARLTPDGELILDHLGRALKDPQLGASRFAIAGHTDAVGTPNYNQTLSEQRAETVKRYLIERYGVTSARLTAAGYGLTQLLDPANPTSAVNRRVEITNIGQRQ